MMCCRVSHLAAVRAMTPILLHVPRERSGNPGSPSTVQSNPAGTGAQSQHARAKKILSTTAITAAHPTNCCCCCTCTLNYLEGGGSLSTVTCPCSTRQVSVQQLLVKAQLWLISSTPPSNVLMAAANAPSASCRQPAGNTAAATEDGFGFVDEPAYLSMSNQSSRQLVSATSSRGQPLLPCPAARPHNTLAHA